MLTEVPVGPLRQLEADEQVRLDAAIKAQDCYTDDDTVYGRNGSRSVIAAGAAVVGSGLVQCVARYRPSNTSAVVVVVIAGQVFTVTDPSAETASDGVATSRGTPFGATAKISAAQLGRYLYLATDESNVAWRRMKPDFSLESLESINQPAQPLATKGSLSWYKYRSNTGGGAGQCAVTGTNCAFSTTASGLLSDWYGIVGTGGDTSQPSDGATAKVTLNTAVDVRGADWIAFGVSPPDDGGSRKSVEIEISHNDSAYVKIGTITDRQPIFDSPNLIFCDVRGVSDTIKAAMKYIRLTVHQNDGSSTLRYALLGHLVMPGRRPNQPLHYFVSAMNPSTLQESVLSPEAKVSTGEQVIVNNDDVKSGSVTYTDQHMGNGSLFHSSALTLNPFDPTNVRIFNRYSDVAMPALEAIGVPITVSGNMPSGYSGNLTGRLWLQTEEGVREVATQASLAAAAAYSLVDNGGNGVLYGKLYRPGGTPPPAIALAAKGGRLAAGATGNEGHREYVSSFTAPSETTDPFPQFPKIAKEEADGWSFDIAPAPNEAIMGQVDGDVLYALTSKRVLAMPQLTPNSLPYEVSHRGLISRRGVVYAEGEEEEGGGVIFWVAARGIMGAANRSRAREISKDIRRLYKTWFQPDSSTVLLYQDQKILAFCGTRFLRLDLVKGRWSYGTLANSIADGVSWLDPGASIEQLWLVTSDRKLARWQESATRDLQVGTSATSGTALPDWKYSTGFEVPGKPIRVKSLLLDVNGAPVSAFVEKTTGDEPSRRIEFRPGESERPAPRDITAQKWRIELRGKNTARVKRIMWEPESIDKKGA